MSDMLAVKKTGAARASVITVPRPTPGHGEVLVQIRACAICASDIAGWLSDDLSDESPGDHGWNPNLPGLTGHEIAGDIVETGTGVDDAVMGNRVWIDSVYGCGHCEHCERGEQSLCAEFQVVTRGFSEYVVVPAGNCHSIPDGMDYATASLIYDIIGTPFNAVRRAKVGPGDSVAVWGLGPVGLGALQMAVAAGADAVVGVDPIEFRRDEATRLGATRTVTPAQAVEAESRFDVVLCTVAAEAGAAQAFDAVAVDGRIMYISGSPPLGGGTRKWVSRSFASDAVLWAEALETMASGLFTLDGFVTHTLPLAEIEDAFAIRIEHPDESLKVVVLNA